MDWRGKSNQFYSFCRAKNIEARTKEKEKQTNMGATEQTEQDEQENLNVEDGRSGTEAGIFKEGG